MNKLRFSPIEFAHLFWAWILISIAFTIILRNEQNSFFYFFSVSLFTVGVGFILHELSHKYFAQKYGCFAEFRADFFMLFLAIGMSFFGFFFAAPGAVFIHGTITTRRNGIISIAGPATNAVLAAVFFIVTFFTSGFIRGISLYGVLINAWLAVFNMIPFGNIDGVKVWRWNKPAYILLVAVSLGFLVLGFVWK
jgi:Zn-dependent protease